MCCHVFRIHEAHLWVPKHSALTRRWRVSRLIIDSYVNRWHVTFTKHRITEIPTEGGSRLVRQILELYGRGKRWCCGWSKI